MKNRILAAGIAAVFALAMPQIGNAHGSMKPSHGGMVQESGEILFELVKTSKGIDVYITEEDEALAATGFDAKLIVTPAAGKKYSAALTPVSGNRFTAAGVKPASGSKVVVSLVDKKSAAKAFATFQLK